MSIKTVEISFVLDTRTAKYFFFVGMQLLMAFSLWKERKEEERNAAFFLKSGIHWSCALWKISRGIPCKRWLHSAGGAKHVLWQVLLLFIWHFMNWKQSAVNHSSTSGWKGLPGLGWVNHRKMLVFFMLNTLWLYLETDLWPLTFWALKTVYQSGLVMANN